MNNEQTKYPYSCIAWSFLINFYVLCSITFREHVSQIFLSDSSLNADMHMSEHQPSRKILEKLWDPCFPWRIISAFLASSDDIPNFPFIRPSIPNSVNRQCTVCIYIYPWNGFFAFVEFVLLLFYKSFCCSTKYLLNGNVCICFGGNSFISRQESDRISSTIIDDNGLRFTVDIFRCDIYSTIVDGWIHEIFKMKIKWNFAPWSEMTNFECETNNGKYTELN